MLQVFKKSIIKELKEEGIVGFAIEGSRVGPATTSFGPKGYMN